MKIEVQVSFRKDEKGGIIVEYQNGDSFDIITPDGLGKLGFPDEIMKEAYKFRASLMGARLILKNMNMKKAE